MNPLTVDFRIIGNCHMRCPFCHGAPKFMPGVRLKEALCALEKLKRAGVTRVVFSGGEPLLHKNLKDIIEYASALELEVYLSTSGTMLLALYNDLAPHLDWVGLPLDGSSEEMNRLMGRNPNHFHTTLEILIHFSENTPQHNVKVGTVVSQINIDDILNIGNILFGNHGLYLPQAWRLYEFSPRGDGRENKEKYRISPEEFSRVVSQAIKKFGAVVSPLSNADHDNSYFFVEPDLSIVTASGEEFPYFGNLSSMSADDLKLLFESHSMISKKSERNRTWLMNPQASQILS